MSLKTSEISSVTVQTFLDNYRKGSYVFKEFGYYVAHNIEHDWKITGSSWYTLLLYLCDRHDREEVKFLLDCGIDRKDL